ncbi:MAG: nitrous oxide reductase family maturation protein NosD [Thermoplasmata archaeon]
MSPPVIDRRTTFGEADQSKTAPVARSRPARSYRGKVSAMVVAAFLFGSFLVVLLSYSEPAASYTSHEPIIIDGATDLSTPELRASYGIIGGDGSVADPYVICGWSITPSNGGVGISISSRSESFVICEVSVATPAGVLAFAIGLQDVSHVKINDTTLSNAIYGVQGVDSSYVTVESNSIHLCDVAVELMKVNTYPDDCRILNNTMSSGSWGIHVSDARYGVVSGNAISAFSGYGLYAVASDYSNFSSNEVSDCSESGTFLESSDYCVIYNNTYTENYGWYAGGVYVYECLGTSVYHNSFRDNTGELEDQAYDNGGSGNVWNWPLPLGGNYWSDWTTPDDEAPYGIVDDPYVFTGGQDAFPLTEPPGTETPIPEFGSVVVPVILVMALFLVVSRRRSG